MTQVKVLHMLGVGLTAVISKTVQVDRGLTFEAKKGVMISVIAGDDEGESPQGNICDMKQKMNKE